MSEGMSRRDPVRDHIGKVPPLSAGQVDWFLARVEAGLTRREAAVEVQAEWDRRRAEDPEGTELCHATASRFRRLYFADPVFAERYDRALETQPDGEDGTSEKRRRLDALERLRMVERAFDEYYLRAIDPERGRSGSSNRALLNLLTLMSRTFKPFLEARVRHVHTGAVGLFAQPTIDTSKLSLEEQRELIELERRRQVLIEKARPEEGPVPTDPFSDDGDVVEGEATELPALGSGE